MSEKIFFLNFKYQHQISNSLRVDRLKNTNDQNNFSLYKKIIFFYRIDIPNLKVLSIYFLDKIRKTKIYFRSSI